MDLHAEGQDGGVNVRMGVAGSKDRLLLLAVLFALQVLQQPHQSPIAGPVVNNLDFLCRHFFSFGRCPRTAPGPEADGGHWAVLFLLLAALLLLLGSRGAGRSSPCLLASCSLLGFLFVLDLLGSERLLGGAGGDGGGRHCGG